MFGPGNTLGCRAGSTTAVDTSSTGRGRPRVLAVSIAVHVGDGVVLERPAVRVLLLGNGNDGLEVTRVSSVWRVRKNVAVGMGVCGRLLLVLVLAGMLRLVSMLHVWRELVAKRRRGKRMVRALVEAWRLRTEASGNVSINDGWLTGVAYTVGETTTTAAATTGVVQVLVANASRVTVVLVIEGVG